MATTKDKFAGGDQTYLRDEQYRNSTRLRARADLHIKHSTSRLGWFDWVLPKIGLVEGTSVLEAGCGGGWLWTESSTPIPARVSLTLTDLSPGMVEESVEQVMGIRRYVSVTGREADLQSLPFDDGSFDRVVANHMLYHLPDPVLGVSELARVVKRDGAVIVATNGRRHMHQLWRIRGDVFGVEHIDRTLSVFGAEVGFPILRDQFDMVEWHQFRDSIRCTDPADVMAFVCSSPPAEDAPDELVRELERQILAAFDEGGGVMSIDKDSGVFICRSPRLLNFRGLIRGLAELPRIKTRSAYESSEVQRSCGQSLGS